MEQFLCVNCVKDEELKDLINHKGERTFCSLCKKQDAPVLNCADKELKNLFKGLVRFHYSQWEYDHNFGGDDICLLFEKENTLLNDWISSGTDDGDDLWNVITELVWSAKYNDEVTIVSDNPYVAIKNDYCRKIRCFNDQLQEKNYYEVEREAIAFLKDIINETDVAILNGANYYRARVDFSKCGIPRRLEWYRKIHFMPYKDTQIGRVPPPRSKNGRMNRQGVSFLYLASDLCTAVAEVRPYPGQYVSTGKFVSSKDIHVVDLTNLKINKYSSDTKLDDFLTLKTINELFSRPVPNQTGNQYVITQLLADVIRKLGYDGVVYKSHVGSGRNLVIFDHSLFNYTEEEASVVYIKEVRYSYDACNIICDKEEYDLIDKGNDM